MNMRAIKNSCDSTLERNNYHYWIGLITTYEAIKRKDHPRYRFVEEFYKDVGIKRQNFIKYYNKYKGDYTNPRVFLPLKRGLKYRQRRVVTAEIEAEIIRLRRERGINRYEIRLELEQKNLANIPSHSTIYRILKEHNLNRLDHQMRGNSRKEIQRIIKENAGDLGHIDCHYLPKNIIMNDNKRYYLLAIMDDASRIVMAKVVPDIQALTVMFGSLEICQILRNKYGIEFKEMLSDNGAEFGGGPALNNKYTHPFERFLLEVGVKHRYTKPYHPQTNGKIERFWKTLHEDMIEDTMFDNLDQLEEEVLRYCLYFNQMRPHSALDGMTPEQQLQLLQSKNVRNVN